MSANHRAEAVLALEHMAVASDISSQMSYSSEATAHALLYVGDQLAQLVEQQKLANTITAREADAHDVVDEHAIDRFIANRVHAILIDLGSEAGQ